MIIGDFEKTKSDSRVRISMQVEWEDSDRESREIFYETEDVYEDDIEALPDAFLVAAVMPALEHRERRILVRGEVCPRLRNGIQTVMQIFRRWYVEREFRPVVIEASEGFVPRVPRQRRTASFLSGGVDALSTLRSNRADYPPGHHGYIRDCFFIHGLDIGGIPEIPDNRDNSETAIAALRQFTGQIGAELIPIITNLRHLEDDDNVLYQTFYGAAIASVAHTFTNRIDSALIASGPGVNDLSPSGSNMLIDMNYSSCRLAVEEDGSRFSRLDKVRMISEWPEALRTLRTCWDEFRSATTINCGKCEKCLRTMTSLYVLGKLPEATTYAENEITVEMLESLNARPSWDTCDSRDAELRMAYSALSVVNMHFWEELIAPLREVGRNDLAGVVEEKLRQLTTPDRTRKELRQRLSEWDQRFLGSILSNTRRRFRN